MSSGSTCLICLSCPTEHQKTVVPLCREFDVCILFGQAGDELDRLRSASTVNIGQEVVHVEKAPWQPMWKMGVVRGSYAFITAKKATRAIFLLVDATGAGASVWSEVSDCLLL